VIGYPGGGAQQIVGARVVLRTQPVAPDIYSQQNARRDIYVLQSRVRKGDSGGPVVDKGGRAVGVVFAASKLDDLEGFALTNAELRAALAAARGRNAAVPTGACAT
jgi:S1-C subfamily serine protease